MLGIFLDSETNGLNAQKHKIIEIFFKIIDIETKELKCEYGAVVCQPKEAWAHSDPASLQVNGFTWEEVAAGKMPAIVAEEIKNCFAKHQIKRGEAVFICQNPSFDRAFFSQIIDPDTQERLLWPYHWLDLASMFWAEGMRNGKTNPARLPWKLGFSKDRIAAAYGLPPEGKPHRAANGVAHLLLCYEAIVGFPKRLNG